MSTSTADHVTAKLFDNIKKLKADGSNWDVWKSQIMMVLQHCKLIRYAEGSVSQPAPSYPPNTPSPPPLGISPTNAAAIQDWEDKNLEAQIQIYMTLEHEVTSLVSKKNTALDVWLALHSKFEGKGLTALSMLATQFWTYWMLLDQDIMAQVQEIKSIALKLSSLGYPLSEEYQAMGILMALPPEWSLICSIILNKTGPFTLQGTIDSLLEYENTLKQDQGADLAAHQARSQNLLLPSLVIPKLYALIVRRKAILSRNAGLLVVVPRVRV